MPGVHATLLNVSHRTKRRLAPVRLIPGQPAPMRMMQGHTELVSAVAFFKNGRWVVTGSWDRTVQIWDMKKGALVGEPFKGHNNWVQSVAISPDDERFASCGYDKTVIIWDVKRQQKVFDPLMKHTDTVFSVCFSPDGKKLASGSGDKTVVLWDAETGAVIATLDGHRDWVLSVAFSPDGLKLASGSSDCTIRVWSADNAEQLFEIDAHQQSVTSVVWWSDGQQLVSASWDSTVKFWDSYNGDQIGPPCTGHTDSICSLIINSSNSIIATASDDRTVRLWSTKTHQQIGHALKHTACAWCVSNSPNGELLASGDDEGKVLLWSVQDALELCGASELNPSYNSFFVHRSKAKLGRHLYLEALHDAEKVIELDPLSCSGYELKHAALHGAQRYDEAIDAFKTMLSKLDHTFGKQRQKLLQQYVNPAEVEEAIQQIIDAHLDNAPLRLLNTTTGRLCNRDGQINLFMKSTQYKEILSSSMTHTPLQRDPIKKGIAKYFSWAMLSHRWGKKEPLLRDIQYKVVYDLKAVGGNVKLQMFCKVAREAGYHWAWSDTCCIDQSNTVELQESVNSMFIWYRHSALTIIYLSDVPPSSESGALANSVWNTRGWTVQEFLAPAIVLFYQADWTVYLDDRSPNHKESVVIMQELEQSTGIHAGALVAFRPGMKGAREKLQWASTRVTTLQEDIAYSLFGIFGVHLPVIYGEKKENALGRLLQEIIAHSGDITALDWVGKASKFNSCLPADITSYKAPPCPLPSLSEDEIQTSVSTLRTSVVGESASELYTLLDNLSAPRFANSRLQLPCIAFPVTAVRRKHEQDQETCFTYDVKADGLHDMIITTQSKLTQFWPARPTRQTFLLVRPWDRYDLELPDFANDTQTMEDWPEPGSPTLEDTLPSVDVDTEPADAVRALRLLVRLGQPFGALFLAQQRGGEFKRIASDNNIIARVRDITSSMMDVRTLEIL